ncbi:hypothetical protein Ddye_014098 [Dipteronia dyeriana]|uniref:Protein kinase domain-containing protein n=1 Tax=Dipteronia dyeriana TaxID=168575 RepID=A0AAD9X7L6_9ROSI|nr:hypothetical protein Ddye_014098 [Dipteronia dyeriana]
MRCMMCVWVMNILMEWDPKSIHIKLATVTNNFEETNRLGQGGSRQVYKGFLSDLNSFVAMKKILKNYGKGNNQFVAEIKIISRLRHRNIVKLLGWSHERDLMLLYEFMPNGNLISHIFKGNNILV